MQVKTPWVYSQKFDMLAILGPPIFGTAIVAIWSRQLLSLSETPTWLWIVLVLGIDVAHVYSSLYRTYFDKEEFEKRKRLYIAAPLLSWSLGVAIFALFGPKIFWTCVAYFAIYHFVRQQYGFMMLYRRGEPSRTWQYRVDQAAIYLATVYPLIYWHTYPRNFQWFSDFEVIHIPVVWPEIMVRYLYILVLFAYLVKEIGAYLKTREFNLGKSLLLGVTALAWTTGIIIFNGDLTFTIINIVAHGIPYMALIWIYQYRKRAQATTIKNRFLRFFHWKYIPIYVGSLVLFSYLEEGVWDWFVWKEHSNLFGTFKVDLSSVALMFLVPLLTMPQVTHYVLDAFIWRVNKKGQTDVRAVIG